MTEDLELKIEKYLAGAMTPEEVLAFENKMDKDEALKNEVLITEDLNLFLKSQSGSAVIENKITSKEEKEIRDNIANIHSTYKNKIEVPSEIKKKSRNSKVIYLITSIAAVFLIFIGVYFSSLKSNNSELWASYYTNDDLPSFTTRSSDGNLLSAAATSYKNQDLDKALSQFEDYIKTAETIDPLVYIYTGMIYVKKNKLTAAISQLELLEDSNSIDAERAYWFKALIYLKFDDKESAIKNLKTLQSANSNYKKNQVIELLDNL